MLAAAAEGSHLPPAAGAAPQAPWVWSLLVLLPIAAALFSYPISALLRVKSAARPAFLGRWAIACCTGVFLLLLGLWAAGVPQGALILPGFAGYGIDLSITPASLLFCLFAAWLWMLAAFFSRQYLAKGRAHSRYYLYYLLCLGGTMGTFLAGNLLTLFIFFELVSLGGYPLVVHEETEEALAAGRLYLFLSVAGGLAVFFGAALLHGATGGTVLAPGAAAGLPQATAIVIACLLLFGFGVKAGLAPVHIWLPRAHPVAPSPASALLSGVMIKTGAWGIFQVMRLFTGAAAGGHAAVALVGAATAPVAGAAAAAQAGTGELVGRGLVPVALVTMLLGATLALFESNAKRILAYSSVSQIGYVVLGAALAGVLGSGEAMAAAGFASHALAHALFKATMFMLVGMIYLKTHDLDIRKLGPLGRQLPVTAAVFGVAVLGIAGLPGFSGYPSKTLLHDALLLLRHEQGGAAWAAAEAVFIATSAMTVAYMGKLWYFLFVRHPARRPAAVARGMPGAPDGDWEPQRASLSETGGERRLALAAAVPLLAIGLGYPMVLTRLIVPAVAAAGYSYGALHHVQTLPFFTAIPLLAGAVPLAGGAALFAALARAGFPGPLGGGLPSIEGLVLAPLVRGLGRLAQMAAAFDRLLNSAYLGIVRLGAHVAGLAAIADRIENDALAAGVHQGENLVKAAAAADHLIDEGIAGSARASGEVTEPVPAPGPARAPHLDLRARIADFLARPGAHLWSMRNLNMAALLLAAMVALMVLAFLIWPAG